MAYQANGNSLASPTLSQPIESLGNTQQQAASQGNPANAGCQNCQPTPAAGYACGCDNSYNTFSGGGGFPAIGCCGENGCDTRRCCGRQWFGGVYGLYMERDGNPWKARAFSTLDANGPGYYPTDTEYALNLNNIDNDTFSGAEVRLGATIGGCRQSGCGSDCGNGPRHAWKVAYWGLIEDDVTVSVTDLNGDGNRLYGMIDYRGLEYDSGAGYRPVNDYYDYGPPTQPVPAGDTIRVRSLTARNSFTAQNLELNLLHLPVLCGGCYQYNCNWRFFSGYRLLGISGVALAFDQIADANITPAQVGYVDSDGSIYLHGLQAGVECTY